MELAELLGVDSAVSRGGGGPAASSVSVNINITSRADHDESSMLASSPSAGQIGGAGVSVRGGGGGGGGGGGRQGSLGSNHHMVAILQSQRDRYKERLTQVRSRSTICEMCGHSSIHPSIPFSLRRRKTRC